MCVWVGGWDGQHRWVEPGKRNYMYLHWCFDWNFGFGHQFQVSWSMMVLPKIAENEHILWVNVMEAFDFGEYGGREIEELNWEVFNMDKYVSLFLFRSPFLCFIFPFLIISFSWILAWFYILLDFGHLWKWDWISSCLYFHFRFCFIFYFKFLKKKKKEHFEFFIFIN